MVFRTLLTAALILAAVAPSSAAGLKPEWKSGLRLTTEDGSTQIRIGGRIQQDWAFVRGDDELESQLGTFQDGTEFRRGRFYMSGQVDEVVEFKAQYDFAKGTADFRDVYIGLKTSPIFGARIRVGHFNQPMSLEVLTSDNYILAMERGPTSLLAPNRKSGLMLSRPVLDQRVTWAASVYRSSDSQGKAIGEEEWNFGGRLTALPWVAEEDGDVLHLAVSATTRKDPDQVLKVDVEPEAHLMPEFGVLMAPAESWTSFGGEAAVVLGPFSLQVEGIATMTSAPADGEDGTFSGAYALVSWFLTGERRPYSKSSASFGRVQPAANYGQGGKGAVQVVARVSRLDLEDGDLRGGTVDGITLGLNWYLNPNARVMLNYVRSDGSGVAVDDDHAVIEADGVGQAFQTRFQISF